MTEFLVILVTSLVLGLFAQGYLPWWYFAVIAFIVGLWRAKKGWIAFLTGFLAIFILWLGMSAYLDALSSSRLTTKLAAIFSLGSSYYLYIITLLIGGLVGGLASLSGFWLKRAFNPPRKT